MSAHPEFEIAGSFAHLKLGKKPPVHDPRTLQFATYIDDAVTLPATPPRSDWTLSVHSWPMYGNDRYGDCTVAAAGHMIEAWSTAVGKPRLPSDADVVNAYWATGDGTDDGRAELDVLNYWRHTGIGSDKILAYVAVNPSNIAHVKAAIYLFGGVYIGVALPVTAQGQKTWSVVGDGKTGDSAPGSWGGHAIPYHAYDARTFKCVTWGGVVSLDRRFHMTYVDECYAVLSHDWLNASGKSPAGFNLTALRSDLTALKG